MSRNFATLGRKGSMATVLIAVVLVGTVGPALAAPQVFLASASLDTETALAGDQVNVTLDIRNSGDSGAATIKIKANGTVKFSDRYQVDSGGQKVVTEQISFADPGTYRITVNSKEAGNLTVRRAVAETRTVRSDGRSMVLRGGRIPYDSEVTAAFPSTNDTVAIESLQMRSLRNEFRRNVEIHTDPSNAPFAVPTGDATTVLGAVSVESISSVDDRRIRIAVNQSTAAESGLAKDDVSVYSQTQNGYERVETTHVETTDSRYVYEAPVTDASALVVGSLAPSFAVEGYSLSTSTTETDKRIVVTANVTNDGSIGGDYTASLRIDGANVSNQTVSLDPGQRTELSVSHRITADGSYRVSLNDRYVGEVVVATNSQVTATESGGGNTATETTTTERPTDTTETASEKSTETQAESEDATATDQNSGEASLPIPAADSVGLTEVGIGAGVAVIGVILVLLQRW
jgi:hypothetical protein